VITDGYFDDGGRRLDVFLEDGWFLTGDIGYLDEDGVLFVTGRRKNMIIRGGEKLYLEDLDRCLRELPGIVEACTVQAAGVGSEERAVAFLVAGAQRPADAEVIAHAQERLGHLGRPDQLIWIERIPVSATGKPLRASLEAIHRRLVGASPNSMRPATDCEAGS
jgi:long-chain acyl-CoA synthetase